LKLNISEELKLPVDAATRTFGILAMRGAGKSNSAVVMAEEMFKAGVHWVAIDPKGDWWGIRSSQDGKSAGLPVVIFGGRRGDVPLEPASGAFIAELVIEQRLTCILDLSEFTEGEKIHFLAGNGKDDGFAARFYRRKDPTQPPTHLFLEEADDYLPQRVDNRKAKLLHDCSRMVLWGRQRGIGGTCITQRSARLNKDVLTQTENLIVLRTTGPQDRDAILEWVKHHGQGKELVDSLPELRNGEAWLWSPEWLQTMKRIHFRRRETFDSGATPAAGAKSNLRPATLADIDLGSVRDKMAETIERAKADDPKELRRQIAELKKQIAAKPIAAAPKLDEAAIRERIEQAVKTARKRMAAEVARAFSPLVKHVRGFTESVLGKIPADTEWRGVDDVLNEISEPRTGLQYPQPPRAAPPPPVRRSAPSQAHSNGNGILPQGERALLIAAAQYPNGVTRKQLTVLGGYKRSTRDAYIQRLATREYLDLSGDMIRATDAGIAALGGDFEPLPTGQELIDHWLTKLPEGERAIFQLVVERGGNWVDRASLDEPTGYKRSTRDAYIQRMVARGVIDAGARGQIRASEELFQ